MRNEPRANVAVIGLGYIGLPTATVLATRGLKVVGVDVDPQIVSQVSRGEVPFAEPDLAAAVSGAVAMEHLTAREDPPEADVFIIAVPTPLTANHEADLSYVRAAIEAIAPRLTGTELIVLESTSPPGTTERIAEWMSILRPDITLPDPNATGPRLGIAHCPERVLPGRILVEIITNDRIIGGLTPACADRAAELYAKFCQGQILTTTARTAELTKLVENSFRDVNIAFANELANICDFLFVDPREVIELANRHPRVNILAPGPGVGGHCIPVDPWFIVGAAPHETHLVRTAREVNDARPRRIADLIAARAQRFRDPRIACLGLSYKANVDDTRESPAIDVVQHLATHLADAEIRVCDPFVQVVPAQLARFENVLMQSVAEAVSVADIVVLLVEHAQFKTLSKTELDGKVIFDTKGLWRR